MEWDKKIPLGRRGKRLTGQVGQAGQAETQPPASPSCMLYEPEAIGPTARRAGDYRVFLIFLCAL